MCDYVLVQLSSLLHAMIMFIHNHLGGGRADNEFNFSS